MGEIRMFAFEWAPTDWALANGALMSVAQNNALFTLLGSTYGGDGQTTFALPDLRGRAPVHFDGPNSKTNYRLGHGGGHEQVVLRTDQVPAHTHQVLANAAAGDIRLPVDGFFAAASPDDQTPAVTPKLYGPTISQPVSLHRDTVVPAGSGAGHDNMQPSFAINFCIALLGYYPARPQ
jgi:microcystin-dependent protein